MGIRNNWLVAAALLGAAQSVSAHDDAGFEADRRAILSMAGEFEVKFRFDETVSLREGYELKHDTAGGFETVIVAEDTGKRIVLQHILVSKDGEHVVKHWRQDWTYEDRDLREFAGGRTWTARHLSAREARGAWTQAVYEVNDGPRYESIGHWDHEGAYASWQSAVTWRPLPRREYSTRKDYDVLLAVNRQAITPWGWVHEQDNTKWDRGNRDGHPYIARELGVNEYRRITTFDFAPARAYFDRTKGYWRAVRATWDRLLAGSKPLEVAGGAEVAEALDRVYELANETTPEPGRILEAQELIRSAVKPAIPALASR
ncbi:MAG TPA: DUF6607 family protein [Steroidobacteraceae bacterium]|nr:DUF6607 family protein [Steroidobacteraceae bacterium]